MNEPRCGCDAAILRDWEILLIRRRNAPEADHWGLPGGKVDWLEPVETAVIREVEEELGIVIGGLRLLCIVDQIDTDGGEHWIAPVYRAATRAGEPRIAEPHKHSAFGWFDLKNLPSPLTRAAQVALAALTAGQQKHDESLHRQRA